MFKRRFYVRAPDGDDLSAGGAAGGAAAGSEGGASTGDAAGSGSALAAGAAAASGGQGAAAAGDAADPNAWIPEKHRVAGQDGALDIEASARKVAEAYGHLERRLGGAEAPPSTADEYKVNVPESLKDALPADELTKSAEFKGFLGKLHAAGASQKIVDVAVAELLEAGVKMHAAAPVLAEAECVATLKQVDGWKTNEQYAAQIQHAWRAAKGFGEKGGVSMDEIEKAGLHNHPLFIRIMAAVGPEMEEDRGITPAAQGQLQDNLDSLMNSPAYLNGNHPMHHDTVAKVTALTARMTGTRPVASGKTMSFQSG